MEYMLKCVKYNISCRMGVEMEIVECLRDNGVNDVPINVASIQKR